MVHTPQPPRVTLPGEYQQLLAAGEEEGKAVEAELDVVQVEACSINPDEFRMIGRLRRAGARPHLKGIQLLRLLVASAVGDESGHLPKFCPHRRQLQRTLWLPYLKKGCSRRGWSWGCMLHGIDGLRLQGTACLVRAAASTCGRVAESGQRFQAVLCGRDSSFTLKSSLPTRDTRAHELG